MSKKLSAKAVHQLLPDLQNLSSCSDISKRINIQHFFFIPARTEQWVCLATGPVFNLLLLLLLLLLLRCVGTVFWRRLSATKRLCRVDSPESVPSTRVQLSQLQGASHNRPHGRHIPSIKAAPSMVRSVHFAAHVMWQLAGVEVEKIDQAP